MPDEPSICPLDDYQGVLRSVPVHVNGAPRRFLFDLGAGVTSLDADVARELGTTEVARHVGKRMTGQEVEFALVEGARVSVAGRDFDEPRLGVLEIGSLLPPEWPKVDGVLALDLWEGVPFTADFGRSELRFGGPPTSAQPLRFRLHRQIPGVSLVVLVAVSSPAGDLWFELDNSNVGPVIISPSSASALGLGEQGDGRLDLDGWGPFETPYVTKPILYDGNLGWSFCDGRAFTFDLTAGRLGAST